MFLLSSEKSFSWISTTIKFQASPKGKKFVLLSFPRLLINPTVECHTMNELIYLATKDKTLKLCPHTCETIEKLMRMCVLGYEISYFIAGVCLIIVLLTFFCCCPISSFGH